MPKIKKRINLLVNPRTLKKWDELADSVGISRTALIHNAIKVYELFIKNQLNGNKKESIQEQLYQLKILMEGYQKHLEILESQEKGVDTSIIEIETKIPDFEIIAEKILNLLMVWGALPEATIAAHLQYPGWIVWTVLKKLKEKKQVKVERGEWSLYEK